MPSPGQSTSRDYSAARLTYSEPVSHNLAPSFENTVKLWLDQTATKTKQWADAALGVDTVSGSLSSLATRLMVV